MSVLSLSEDRKVGYSPFEREVFERLMLKVPKSTIDITEEIYADRNERPYNARQSVLGALTSLTKKAKHNREAFTIRKSRRQGPHPVNFWLEK